MKPSRTALGIFTMTFLVFAYQILNAQTPVDTTPTPTYDQATSLLEQGRMTLKSGPLLQAWQVLEPCANTATGRVDCCYQGARACLYLSRSLDLDKNRKQAEKWDETGITLARKAVLLNDSSADAHSLLALLYETNLSYGDMFTGMDIGPKADAENKKAMSLDLNNAQVQLAAGIQYVMAPPIGGGDIKKGITTLEKVLELDSKMDEAYYWLAKAYRKQNDRVGFKKALDSALQLNPQNRMAQKELSEWK